MRQFASLAAAATVLACLVACSSTGPRHDQPDPRTLVQPIEVRLNVPQADLYVHYDPSWKSQSVHLGLCLLVNSLLCLAPTGLVQHIDADAIKEAETRARPLKDAIADVPFADRFIQVLSTELTSNDVRVQTTQVVRSTTTSWMNEEAFGASTASSVLFMGVRYSLSPDFSRFEVVTRTEVFLRSEAARQAFGLKRSLADDPIRGSVLSPTNALYKTDFHYEAVLAASSKVAEENAQRWQSDGGRLIREAILGGIEQAARSVAHDFGTTFWSAPPSLPRITTREGKNGRLIREIPGKGRLLKLDNGGLLFEATLTTLEQAAR